MSDLPPSVPQPPGARASRVEAAAWIARLDLERHPEGGWYRQIHRSSLELSGEALAASHGGPRSALTVIYYLLEHPDVSRLHRLASDETWHFHAGRPLRIVAFDESGSAETTVLGPGGAHAFVAAIPAGRVFGAELLDGGWALVSCVVAPGFEFEDFELVSAPQLGPVGADDVDTVQRLTAPSDDGTT